MATGIDVSAAELNKSLGATMPSTVSVPANIVSLWAWEPVNSKWYFYAPSLDASGGLVDFIVSKGYLDFVGLGKTLANGEGFWVNRP